MSRWKIKSELTKVFDKLSKTYLRRRPWFKIFKYIPKADIVLDVGCGTGQYSVSLLTSGKCVEVMGVDLSFEMLKACKARAVRDKVDTYLYVIQADMENLPIRSNSVDLVLAIASLHHLLDRSSQIEALKEMSRCMRCKGILIATVWSILQLRFATKVLKNIIMKVFKPYIIVGNITLQLRLGDETFYRYYHLFKPRELIGIVKSVGLKVIYSGGLKVKSKVIPENWIVIGEKICEHS